MSCSIPINPNTNVNNATCGNGIVTYGPLLNRPYPATANTGLGYGYAPSDYYAYQFGLSTPAYPYGAESQFIPYTYEYMYYPSAFAQYPGTGLLTPPMRPNALYEGFPPPGQLDYDEGFEAGRRFDRNLCTAPGGPFPCAPGDCVGPPLPTPPCRTCEPRRRHHHDHGRHSHRHCSTSPKHRGKKGHKRGKKNR